VVKGSYQRVAAFLALRIGNPSHKAFDVMLKGDCGLRLKTGVETKLGRVLQTKFALMTPCLAIQMLVTLKIIIS
jgi:hypothetical protein